MERKGQQINRDRWKQITKVTVLRSDQKISLTPTQGKQEEEQTRSLTRGCDFFVKLHAPGFAWHSANIFSVRYYIAFSETVVYTHLVS